MGDNPKTAVYYANPCFHRNSPQRLLAKKGVEGTIKKDIKKEILRRCL